MVFEGQRKIYERNGYLVLLFDDYELMIGDIKTFVPFKDNFKQIKCDYVINEKKVSFKIRAKYNKSKVIIDPFIFSSIQGDGKLMSGDKNDLKIDKNKNIYSVMPVSWEGLPMTDIAYMKNGTGIAISKLSSDGKRLIFRTFLGKTANYRVGNIELDEEGNIVVFGSVDNNNHPVLGKAFKTKKIINLMDSLVNLVLMEQGC